MYFNSKATPITDNDSLVPRLLFSIFICGGGKKGMVDLRRNFLSTRSTDFGGR